MGPFSRVKRKTLTADEVKGLQDGSGGTDSPAAKMYTAAVVTGFWTMFLYFTGALSAVGPALGL